MTCSALARDLVTRTGCGFLMVTHSARLAATLDRQVHLHAGTDRMSRAIWILAVLLSHWRRHPMQFATLLIGLISATALWSGVQALNQQARMQLRPRRGDVRRRANGDAGRPRRRDFPATTVCRSAPRRLAGLAGARRPRPDRRTLVPAARHRADHAAGRGRQRAGDRKGRPAIVLRCRPAKRWSRRKRCPISSWREGAAPTIGGAIALPPLKIAAQLVPGVLVVDIGIAQRAAENAGPDFAAADRQGKGNRAPLEAVAGDRLRLVEPDAESDLERLTDSFHLNLTAFGLLSFLVGLFIVNSAIGLAFEQRLPMLRTLRACGVSARMLNAVW